MVAVCPVHMLPDGTTFKASELELTTAIVMDAFPLQPLFSPVTK